MKTTMTRSLLMSVAVAALGGCASITVRSDYDHTASFTGLSTYTWMESSASTEMAGPLAKPFLERRIRATIQDELERRGFQRDTSGTPDFLVSYSIDSQSQAEISSYGVGYGYGSYRGSYFYDGSFGYAYNRYGFGFGYPWGYGYGTRFGVPAGYVREYIESTLVIDVVDARTGRHLWRGWATARLNRNPEPAELNEFVARGVEQILMRFPPEREGS